MRPPPRRRRAAPAAPVCFAVNKRLLPFAQTQAGLLTHPPPPLCTLTLPSATTRDATFSAPESARSPVGSGRFRAPALAQDATAKSQIQENRIVFGC